MFRHPPHGTPLPALSLVDDQAVLTALSNDVGFELVFSRQLIAHAGEIDMAIGFSTSGDSVNMLRAFEEAARRDVLTVGLCGYEGSGMAVSDAVHHCLVVRSESVHRIQEVQKCADAGAVGVRPTAPARDHGRRCTGGPIVTGAAPEPVASNGNTAPGDREAAVFGRIEAFRRRRPRLRDDVVTLAHGAGGKASAALLEAVFLPAFSPGDEEGHRPAQTDAALLELPSGDRLAFSTDSYVVKPLRFPGGSAGHLAVHGTINDLAMMGARPIAISAAFVLEEGHGDRRPARGGGRHGRGGGPRRGPHRHG